MNYEMDRAWAEVFLDRLAHNYQALSNLVGEGCAVMAVIKGNAYGHGAPAVARELERAGCPLLGAATVEEAMELREQGVMLPILLLGPIEPGHTALAAEQKLILPAVDEAFARAISDQARRLGVGIAMHLALDTGMSRYGLQAGRDFDGCLAAALRIAGLPGIRLEGLFTHFAAGGDPAEDAFTLRQLALFDRFGKALRERGLKLTLHCANSPVTLRFPQARYDMVRAGTLLYGLNPFGGDVQLQPVMELRTRIVQLKELEPDDTVGYGRLFTCRRRTRIAIVPFGFADGIHRSASNRAVMLVRGRQAPIVGKICMDLCFLDVTDIPDAQRGDTVTIFGHDHGAFLSPYACTSFYPGSAPELTAVLGRRIPRFYLRDGSFVGRDGQ